MVNHLQEELDVKLIDPSKAPFHFLDRPHRESYHNDKKNSPTPATTITNYKARSRKMYLKSFLCAFRCSPWLVQRHWAIE